MCVLISWPKVPCSLSLKSLQQHCDGSEHRMTTTFQYWCRSRMYYEYRIMQGRQPSLTMKLSIRELRSLKCINNFKQENLTSRSTVGPVRCFIRLSRFDIAVRDSLTRIRDWSDEWSLQFSRCLGGKVTETRSLELSISGLACCDTNQLTCSCFSCAQRRIWDMKTECWHLHRSGD